jgi:hypothetical protein
MFRSITITEKLDGTNASVFISPEGQLLVGSRSRWITPEDDNFAFAAFVRDNEAEIRLLGPGHHFGEWWGRGIQRGYGMVGRKFSLFNTRRWVRSGETPGLIESGDPRAEPKYQSVLPSCVDLVPVLYQGIMDTTAIDDTMAHLSQLGSQASPGWTKPEGIIVYHSAANHGFKVTFDKSDQAKSSSVAF